MSKARDIASAIPAPSTVSATELGYLDGVTSAIQTQLDAKAPSSTAVTLTGTQTLTNKTLTNPVIASVVNNTLTSTTGDMIYASGANTPARLGIGSTSQVLTVSGGVPTWATPSGSSFVGVKVTANADQTISNETSTDVTWNTEEYDTDAFHSTTTNTNRLTVPNGKDGYYKIWFSVKFTNSANATGRRIISMQLNGTEISDYETHALSGVFPSMVCSITKNLIAGDYVALQAYQGSGGDLGLRKSSSSGSFGMEKIG